MGKGSWIGQIIGGRYRVDELIGQGGMSSVYKAFDPNLKRVVAIKMIHQHLSEDPKFVIRFEEEAKAVAQLRHSNIVQVYDFNLDDGAYYMVQEFVPGETLQSRLERLENSGRRMSLEDAIKFTMDICSALGYAHQRDMIHRDIKPANIMLDIQGQAVLMDFGIVKITGGEKHTATGAVVGTAMYMSPELIRGETADSRSDIYSLGVTLFEMVSGRPPFYADSAMTLMMMHLNDPVPDLHQLRPEVPEDLIAVIEKAVAKDKRDRYNSGAEMAAALNRVLDRIEGGIPYEATFMDSPQMGDDGTEGMDGEGTLIDASRESHQETRPVIQPRSSGPPQANSLRRETPSSPMRIPETTRGTGQPTRQSAGNTTGQQGPGYSQAYPTGEPADSNPLSGLPAPGGGNLIKLLLAGAAVAVLVFALVAGGIFLGSQLGRDNENLVAADFTDVPDTGDSEGLPLAAVQSTTTIEPTRTPGPTATPAPTENVLALPTVPAGIPYVRLNSIKLDDQNSYTVEFETFEFAPDDRSTHVHFFFNIVGEENAGEPGSGPWMRYEDTGIFTALTTEDRPEEAALICALVANPDHSIRPGSGTCLPLPDVPVAVASVDTVCRVGPGDEYSRAVDLQPRDAMLIRGISQNELWWQVQNPDALTDSCWVRTSEVQVTGSSLLVPVVTAEVENALITRLAISPENTYIVDYETNGDIGGESGNHVHFFFDTIPVEEAGVPGEGPWIRYTGVSPYTEFSVSDTPTDATQLCIIVANADHSIRPGTGNCWDLSAASPQVGNAQVTGISIGQENNYHVNYETYGEVGGPNGVHVHFFFDTVPPEQAGVPHDGPFFAYLGDSPYTELKVSDRPAEAERLCIIVANPDHTAWPGTGNCEDLP